MSTQPQPAACNYKGIVLAACTRWYGGVCLRCGKKRGK